MRKTYGDGKDVSRWTLALLRFGFQNDNADFDSHLCLKPFPTPRPYPKFLQQNVADLHILGSVRNVAMSSMDHVKHYTHNRYDLDLVCLSSLTLEMISKP